MRIHIFFPDSGLLWAERAANWRKLARKWATTGQYRASLSALANAHTIERAIRELADRIIRGQV